MESFEKKIKERNNLLKSQVESLTGRNELVEVVETLLKAGVAEEDLVEKAKYIRREPDGKGGYKYIYEEPKENKIKTDKVDKNDNYIKYKELKDKQNKIVDDLSSKLNSFPKDKSGIVPDNIRSSSEFKEAKKQFDTEFKKLQDINSSGIKLYKKEMDEERKNKRVNLSNKSSESDLEKAKADKKQQKKIKKVMDEWKAGTLLDSHGNKITDRKQVLAVALSEAGLSKKE